MTISHLKNCFFFKKRSLPIFFQKNFEVIFRRIRNCDNENENTFRDSISKYGSKLKSILAEARRQFDGANYKLPTSSWLVTCKITFKNVWRKNLDPSFTELILACMGQPRLLFWINQKIQTLVGFELGPFK